MGKTKLNKPELQMNKLDEFNYVFTKAVSKEQFVKELETVYNNRFKAIYEQDGFRKGLVPFKTAMLNGQLASQVLELVARADREIMLGEILEEMHVVGSIYDIKNGENQTDFAGFDLNKDEPVIFELSVEVASFVDEVNYEAVEITADEIKTKKATDEEIDAVYNDYKKIKEPLDVVGEDSFIDLVFTDGNDVSDLTFDLGTTPEEDELKLKTFAELRELTIGKTIGEEFDYTLTGEDGTTLEVKATIGDIYNVRTLTDEEFIEMLKESVDVETEKDQMTIEAVKETFRNHMNEQYEENLDDEIKSLMFDKLLANTTGIHYNEREIQDLNSQFLSQVSQMAEQEGMTMEDYVADKFETMEALVQYSTVAQRARVLHGAIYRNIGRQLKEVPTYMQLEAYVKTFVLRMDPRVTLADDELAQVQMQVSALLSEPLNRQRVVDSWSQMKAEDVVRDSVKL